MKPDLRSLFDVPDDVAYFNTANLSPQLHTVRAAGEQALRRRAHPWTITTAAWFDDVESVRALFAGLIGSTADDVALIPATSYGFAIAARNLRVDPGQRIIVVADEYPSGIYTWRRLAARSGAEIFTVARGPGQSWTDAIVASIDESASIVSVPNVHWTDGALIDLEVVADRTHEVGASLVIDASQSVGALPIDVGRLRPDFLVTVGYKWLLGPFGVGYMYVAPEHHVGEPLEENWIARAGAEDFARLVDYRDTYQPGARRFDVGQRTKFELMPMAEAALLQITRWGVDSVASALAAITLAISDALGALGIIDLQPLNERGPHLMGIPLGSEASATTLTALAAANCYAAVRGGTLRVAPHLHVNDDDVHTLLSVVSATRPSQPL